LLIECEQAFENLFVGKIDRQTARTWTRHGPAISDAGNGGGACAVAQSAQSSMVVPP
jgi:hypothetical protein